MTANAGSGEPFFVYSLVLSSRIPSSPRDGHHYRHNATQRKALRTSRLMFPHTRLSNWAIFGDPLNTGLTYPVMAHKKYKND